MFGGSTYSMLTLSLMALYSISSMVDGVIDLLSDDGKILAGLAVYLTPVSDLHPLLACMWGLCNRGGGGG